MTFDPTVFCLWPSVSATTTTTTTITSCKIFQSTMNITIYILNDGLWFIWSQLKPADRVFPSNTPSPYLFGVQLSFSQYSIKEKKTKVTKIFNCKFGFKKSFGCWWYDFLPARWATLGKRTIARIKGKTPFWMHRQPFCWRRETELRLTEDTNTYRGGDQMQRTSWGSHSQTSFPVEVKFSSAKVFAKFTPSV